jgi:hypothetical protein
MRLLWIRADIVLDIMTMRLKSGGIALSAYGFQSRS